MGASCPMRVDASATINDDTLGGGRIELRKRRDLNIRPLRSGEDATDRDGIVALGNVGGIHDDHAELKLVVAAGDPAFAEDTIRGSAGEG